MGASGGSISAKMKSDPLFILAKILWGEARMRWTGAK
jgi:hypothetical protein